MTHMEHAAAKGTPVLPGQDAFGAIQEIVAILSADPQTDWSKVDIDRLRLHPIDMNLVTLRAKPIARKIKGGVEIAVTGEGEVAGAIKRMVTAQAMQLARTGKWQAAATDMDGGVILTITSANPLETVKIRALGFIGAMATGNHHQAHHLALARGQSMH